MLIETEPGKPTLQIPRTEHEFSEEATRAARLRWAIHTAGWPEQVSRDAEADYAAIKLSIRSAFVLDLWEYYSARAKIRRFGGAQ